MEWEQKAQELRSRCPEAVVQFESGEACVAEVQVREGEMELAMRRISVARESWNRRVAGQEREAFVEEVREVVQQRQLRADSHIDLEMLAEDVTNKVARKVVRDSRTGRPSGSGHISMVFTRTKGKGVYGSMDQSPDGERTRTSPLPSDMETRGSGYHTC